MVAAPVPVPPGAGQSHVSVVRPFRAGVSPKRRRPDRLSSEIH